MNDVLSFETTTANRKQDSTTNQSFLSEEDIDEDIDQDTCGTLTEDEHIFERSAASTSKHALNFTNI
ncbi:14118_t:CDS:2 [Dentiscutata erythropus]|uniref:14118_t:CDS:1 n=1 Tax=Dentiscutata erythropus TaxID=1348616 RepID=A0A9N9EZM1_9GLOM|nr:14118_t:CDS:2 [Dentiscutata erythropus]